MANNKRFPSNLIALLSILSATIAMTVGCAHSENTGERTTVFVGARLIDGSGRDPIDDAMLVVRGDKIESVGKRGTVKTPSGAKVIDVTGKTIIPTLITAHAHLGVVKGPAGGSANITVENVLAQLNQYGRYGIGAVVSLGLDHDFIYTLRDTRNKTRLAEPFILTAGHGFGAGGPPKSVGDQVYRPTSVEEARKDVDELAAHHPDVMKMWVDDFGGGSLKMKPEIYAALIDQAHHHGLKVFAHIYYLADAKALVNDGVDALAHSVRDKPVDDELIDAMKKHGTWLIPTLDMIEVSYVYADKPAWMQTDFFKNALQPGVWEMITGPSYSPQNKDRRVLKLAQANLKKMYDAGVKVGFGTDSGASPLRVQGFAEHRELQLMVQAGLNPLQAIDCATGQNAQMLGISQKMGTLSPGKQASFILLGADPTTNIENTEKIESVWIDGMNP